MLQVTDLAIGLPKSRGSINFDLRPGEIHAMMAESGAGKTGLARILAGLQQPLNGPCGSFGDGSLEFRPAGSESCAPKQMPGKLEIPRVTLVRFIG